MQAVVIRSLAWLTAGYLTGILAIRILTTILPG